MYQLLCKAFSLMKRIMLNACATLVSIYYQKLAAINKAENKYMSAGPITSLSLEQQTES